MQVHKLLLVIIAAAIRLQATRTLLPPSQMHPIEPASMDWHMEVFTPPHEYEVHLKPGYTIDEHLETINKDLNQHIRHRWEDLDLFEHSHYLIHLLDQADLNLIRRDPEVLFVQEAAEYQCINDPMGKEDNGPKTQKHDEL